MKFLSRCAAILIAAFTIQAFAGAPAPDVMRIEGSITLTDEMISSGVQKDQQVKAELHRRVLDEQGKSKKEYLKTASFDFGDFEFSVLVDVVGPVVLQTFANNGEILLGQEELVLEPGMVSIDGESGEVKGGKYYELVYGGLKRHQDMIRLHEETRALFKKFEGAGEEEQEQFNKQWHAIGVETISIMEKYYNAALKNTDATGRYLIILKHPDTLDQAKMGKTLEKLKDLQQELPHHPSLAESIVSYEELLDKAATRQTVAAVGSSIIDFSAQDLSGEQVSIQDAMKGRKYVLVEFWASWCGPCRAKIPYMKEVYKKYHGKGFDIYSFSLDEEHDAWAEASEEEQLPWFNTSDLKGYDSPICLHYGISAIPANYLVDAQTGKVLARDLRGNSLYEKLTDLLGES